MEREYNIDRIRAISIIGVVVLHVLGDIDIDSLSHGNYILYIILLWMAFCSVNLFGMISGYLRAGRSLHSRSILRIWLQTILICIIICLIVCILLDEKFDIEYLLFPFIYGRLWYIPCYSFVFFVSPYLNIIVDKLTFEDYVRFLIGLFILFSVVPMLYGDIFEVLNGGYSAAWLCFMYFIGAFFKKFSDKIERINVKYMPIFIFICGIIHFLFKLFIHNSLHIFYYYSPLMIMNSIFVFYFFYFYGGNNHKYLSRIIMFISKTSFGIYVIHAHPFFLDNVFVWDNLRWIFMKKFYVSVFFLFIVVTIIVVVSGLCDYIILIIFKWFGIDKLLKKIGSIIDRKLKYELLIEKERETK